MNRAVCVCVCVCVCMCVCACARVSHGVLHSATNRLDAEVAPRAALDDGAARVEPRREATAAPGQHRDTKGRQVQCLVNCLVKCLVGGGRTQFVVHQQPSIIWWLAFVAGV